MTMNTEINMAGIGMSALDSVLADLLTCHDHTALLQKIVDTVVAHSVAHGAYIATLDESGDFMCLIAAGGKDEQIAKGLIYRRGEGIIGRVWDTGELFITEDAVADGAIYNYETKTQLCALPVYDGDTVVAVMCSRLSNDANTSDENPSSLKSELPALQRVVHLASIALYNARLMSESDAAMHQSREIANVSHTLVSVEAFDDACELVCDVSVSALNACASGTVMFDVADEFGDSHTQIKKTCERLNSYNITPWLPPIVDVAERCFRAGKLITFSTREIVSMMGGEITLPPKTVRRSNIEVRDVNLDRDDIRIIAVPIKCESKITGVLTIARILDQAPFGTAVLDTVKTLAIQLGTTLYRQNLTKALHHQAYHDRLTGLPNRYQFEAVFDSLLQAGQSGALLFVDLDGFKEVNDTCGHGVGDKLLNRVPERLMSCLEPNDIVARMGGDEFVVILNSCDDAKQQNIIGERMVDQLKQPFIIDDTSVSVGASIGLSRFPEDGDSIQELLANADVAMYQAKQNGKGCLLRFDTSFAKKYRERARLQADILTAIEAEQFELHYQPQVDCSDGQVTGVEALLRWNHPEKGSISPGIFIPIAEQGNLMNQLGTWVLDKAVYQIAQWQDTSLSQVRVSVNVAAVQFQDDSFVETVLTFLQRHNAPAQLLELEVTESLVMQNVEKVVERLQVLRGKGIRIAVDDFGTGYSSLSYLQELPLDVLKIDRAFVSNIQDETVGQSVASTITLLAQSLGLETVAEGVETAEQRDAIINIGCRSIQGFFHSKAVSVNELPNVIDRLNAEEHVNKNAA